MIPDGLHHGQKESKTQPGADICSDHNVVAMK